MRGVWIGAMGLWQLEQVQAHAWTTIKKRDPAGRAAMHEMLVWTTPERIFLWKPQGNSKLTSPLPANSEQCQLQQQQPSHYYHEKSSQLGSSNGEREQESDTIGNFCTNLNSSEHYAAWTRNMETPHAHATGKAGPATATGSRAPTTSSLSYKL